MKNILIIHGGGRPHGNTAQLIDAFTRGAEEAGHHVERISLLQMKVNPCTGCNACRWGKPCVQEGRFQSHCTENTGRRFGRLRFAAAQFHLFGAPSRANRTLLLSFGAESASDLRTIRPISFCSRLRAFDDRRRQRFLDV